MADKFLVDKIKRVFNDEYLRRNLIKYFVDKGFDNFNKKIYAPVLQDLPYLVPELVNKVEIVPFVKESNPATGQVNMGWNLFVLGTNRVDLGDSLHNNMNEFHQALNGPPSSGAYNALKTPKELIDFIMVVLQNSKSGMVQPQPHGTTVTMPNKPLNRPRMGPTASSSYYEKNRPAS